MTPTPALDDPDPPHSKIRGDATGYRYIILLFYLPSKVIKIVIDIHWRIQPVGLGGANSGGAQPNLPTPNSDFFSGFGHLILRFQKIK